jgi:hypothetical protein
MSVLESDWKALRVADTEGSVERAGLDAEAADAQDVDVVAAGSTRTGLLRRAIRRTG